MGKCHYINKQDESTYKQPVKTGLTAEKLVNNLKLSIFCATKGFLTFSLAFLSYSDYGSHHNIKLQKDAVFTIKKNITPSLEMTIIVPLICFALPAMIDNINTIKCTLTCAMLMTGACFFVRNFHVREWLLEKITDYSKEIIDAEFRKDTIRFPIFDQSRKYIEYNSSNQVSEPGNISFFLICLVFPLKISQSYIMLFLATVELLEAASSFCVDLSFGESPFASTGSNLQRSGHLLYASMRNLVPISRFNELIAERIDISKATYCNT